MTEATVLTRDDDQPSTGVRIPSPEHVERAARLVAVAHGEPEDYWKTHKTEARAVLMVVMNLDKVEGGL